MNGKKMKSIFTKKNLLLLSLAVTIIFTSGIFAIVYTSSYKIDAKIGSPATLVPSDVAFFAEVRNFPKTYELFRNSSFGKAVSKSKQIQKIFSTPEILKIIKVLYYLDLKFGTFISVQDLPSYIDGSVGVSRMKDSSILVTAKTNLKSRFSISLLSKLKSDKKSFNEKSNTKIVSSKSYKSNITSETVNLANIKVSKFSMKDSSIFLVIVNDYLFLSDNMKTIEESLKLAHTPKKAPFLKIKKMKQARKNVSKKGKIFLYADTANSSLAPLAKGITVSDGLVFMVDVSSNLYADIFVVGEKLTGYKSHFSKKIKWENILPIDNPFTMFSRSIDIPSWIENTQNLGSEWKKFKQGIVQIFDDINLSPKKYFKNAKGLVFSYKGFKNENKQIIPHFYLGYGSQIRDFKILKGIFKKKISEKKNFQGVNYSVFDSAKSNYYSTSYLHKNNINFIASNEQVMQSIISSRNHNSSVLKDLSSFKTLGSFAKADNHLIVDIPLILNSIVKIYYLGSDRSATYSRKTIDKDIVTMLEPFNKFKTFHLVMGMKGKQFGKLIVTDN